MANQRSSTHRHPSPARWWTSSPPTGCSSTASSSTAAGSRSRRSRPAPRRSSPRSPRPTRRTSTRRSRPPVAPTSRVWSQMSGAERGKYLFRIARIIQERAREIAVLESIDNGKPIKESRDVDIPNAAAHFFYYAGWADKLEHARLRAGPAAPGGRRPGDPVELPVPDARLEDRPGPGCGQHGGAQACRDHAAHRAAVRGDLPAGRPAARRGEHPHRRGRHRARDRLPRGRRQGRVHRLHRRGSRRSPRRSPGRGRR